MNTDVHKTPAKVALLRRLNREGLLNDKAFTAAQAVVLPASSWFAWAERILLLLGSTLILAGVIFFFAYNWADMGRFLKFGIIEAGIIGCILAAYRRGLQQLSGKILLLSASVLVGVLLAVYGQAYQTGADAFGLFLSWVVLIFAWVLIGEFAALWLVWLVLLNTGIILYWMQVSEPVYHTPYELLCLTVAVLNGTALALREFYVLNGMKWLDNRWLRSILLAATLVPLSFPAIHLIVESNSTDGMTLLAACVWAVVAVGGYICYRFKLPDMPSLAFVVMNICVLFLTLIGNILFDGVEADPAGSALFFALIILAVVSGVAFFLRRTAAAMASERVLENSEENREAAG